MGFLSDVVVASAVRVRIAGNTTPQQPPLNGRDYSDGMSKGIRRSWFKSAQVLVDVKILLQDF